MGWRAAGDAPRGPGRRRRRLGEEGLRVVPRDERLGDRREPNIGDVAHREDVLRALLPQCGASDRIDEATDPDAGLISEETGGRVDHWKMV